MKESDGLKDLEERRAKIKREISDIGYMRAGSLVQNFRKCGKPGCRCAKPGEKGHGPYWLLTRQVQGKTRSRSIPAGAGVEATRAQVAEWRHFQRLSRELLEIDEQLCDVQLRTSERTSDEDAKKGASKRASTRKSQPKSEG